MKKNRWLPPDALRRGSKWLLALLLAGVALLMLLDYWQPLKALLSSDALTLTLGSTKVSLFRILQTLVVMLVVLWVAGNVTAFIEKRVRLIKGVQHSSKELIIKVTQIGLYTVAFLVGLDLAGVDLTTLTVFGGAVGIGLGFGLQKIASNFFSGLILLFEKSIKHGDLIELDDGTSGYVRSTGARYTLLETPDGREIMIPNEDFFTSRVVNWTFSNKRGRVAVTIGVSYNCDLQKARDIMLQAAREHPRCIADPAPCCYLREFADSAVVFLLHFWVEDVTEGRYEPQSDVMFEIWRKFKTAGIEIPFPQRDLHIISTPGSWPSGQ